MSDEYRNALADGTVLDTYRIERVLGEGGFGVTYLVTELNLGKEYAIKELMPDGVAIRKGGTTVMARSSSMEGDFAATRRHFIKEARVLATLKHPAIVAVHRLFEANGTCYMVMDYVEGETLGAYLKRQGGMLGSRAEFEVIFYPLMDGLEVLHGKEMIHRDIKPGNIMVAPDGSPVLLDFGASCRVENHTVTMTQMVSAGYSPFEQYTTRAKQGPYTDIYALGATMVRAITGAKPDDATDRMDEDHYQPLEEREDLLGVYGSDFLVAVDRALFLRKGDRPQSMGEWRKMMEAVVTLAEVEVPESPKPQREERVSEPAPSSPLPTMAPLSDFALRSDISLYPEELPNQPIHRSSAQRIKVGVLVGVCLLVLIHFIAAVFSAAVSDSGKGDQTATTTEEWYRKAAAKGDAKAQYDLGRMYLNGRGVAKDDVEAVKWFRLAAEQGHTGAQYQLGVMYDYGMGVREDDEEAVKWYRLAADQGHTGAQITTEEWYRKAAAKGDEKAQRQLGVIYDEGRWVIKDEREAVKWYRMAAAQGDAKAQFNLGVHYANGRGVTKDDEEAAKWYRMAADQGNASAQYNLGVRYANGRGVTKDYVEAVKWYRLAADQGNAQAQNNLGGQYYYGQGVAKDKEKARLWLTKAAENGNEHAKQALVDLEF